MLSKTRMNTDDKDSKPPKLRLSRQAKESVEEDKSDLHHEPVGKSGKNLKLKTQVPEDEPETPEKPSPPPIPEDTEAVKESKLPGDFATAKEELAQAPDNPSKDLEPQSRQDLPPPPELSNKPPRNPQDESARKVESAIGRISEDSPNSHGLLTSLVVIFVLLAILGGSGYGIYYILQTSGEGDAKQSAEASREDPGPTEEKKEGGEEEKREPSGPIGKAKAAIAKVPSADHVLEAKITTRSKLAPVGKPDDAETAESSENETNQSPASPPGPGRAGPVFDFLENVHVGGVLDGKKPRTILNGDLYETGDLVNADYGLRFIGLRDGKLAFRDTEGRVYLKSF